MKEKECEEQVEHYMITDNQTEFIFRFGIENLHRHLPVGVKYRNGSSLLTGRNSAIDLWGIGNDSVLNIFELKYIRDGEGSKNTKVGILSELLLYVNIMNDIRLGDIAAPLNPVLGAEKKLYARIKDLKGVKGIFLTNGLHPLLEYEKTVDLLNDNKKKISFKFVDYSWDAKAHKVNFKIRVPGSIPIYGE